MRLDNTSKIGDWDVSTLVKFIRDILSEEPAVNFQTIQVEQLAVTSELLLRGIMSYARDASLRRVGRATQPQFENSWAAFGGSTAEPGFWKDPFGIVHLEGLIKSGTVGAAAFTLPPGYRPDSQHIFASVSNDAVGRVDVFADGSVVPATPSSNIWVTLDGITFRAS